MPIKPEIPPVPLQLKCQGYPTDKQTKKARRFGEGFTWTCVSCKRQFVLTQGKGNTWSWKQVKL